MDNAPDTAGLVAELANRFQIPVHEVNATFRDELRRLERDARIRHFVAVLAASHTRAILRKRTRSRASGH